jgi:MGT family glycosyltransferase
MTSPKRYLLAMIDGGGSVPPMLSVARALVARGHEVRVLADAVLAPDVAASGAEHVPWDRAPQRPDLDPRSVIIRDWDARTPLGAFAAARDGVMCGPARRFADDVSAELERAPADVVAGDIFLFGAMIAGEAAGLPVAALVPNPLALPGWGSPPLGPGFAPARGRPGRARDALVGGLMARLFDRGLADLNAARAAHGVAPLEHVLDQYGRADRLLLLTSRAFEYPVFAPPANVRIVGPRLEDPAWAGTWTAPPGDAPLVLVGLSSTYMDQAAALRRIAAALGELPVRGLVTTGPAVAPEAVDAPANVAVVARAPHGEVLREAAAVVTHAGHGTVIKALAAGVPVVAMPMGRDQADNAARAVFHGAGLRVAPGARPGRIAAALRRVLGEPGFAAAAGRLAAAIADETATDGAVEELEALAGDRPRAAVPARA